MVRLKIGKTEKNTEHYSITKEKYVEWREKGILIEDIGDYYIVKIFKIKLI